MKLLIYSHFFAPSIGGVETIVLSLARGLAEVRNEKGTCRIRCHFGDHKPGGESRRTVRSHFACFAARASLSSWNSSAESDVVHVAGPALAPLLLSYILRKPLIVEHPRYQATCPNGLLFHHPSGAVCPRSI